MANIDTKPILDILVQIVAVPPPPPGLGQFMSLSDVSDATKVRLQGLLTRYSDRLNLEAAARRDLAEAVAAIEALVAHGYPTEPIGSADEEMLAEMDARLYAMAMARRKFRGSLG